ncbi:MAG: hypothetical protein RhofKO_31920 [Rhodothermales bacterium]
MKRLLTLLLFTCVACEPPVGAVTATHLVTSFRADPVVNTFVAPVNIRYALKQPAWVSLRVVVEDSTHTRYLVQDLQQARHESSGTHHAAWIGTDASGRFAPKGHYLIELYAQPAEQAEGVSFAVPVYVYRN